MQEGAAALDEERRRDRGVPVPALPQDSTHVRACGVLHLTLDRWATAGGDMPLSWAMLREQAEVTVGGAAGSEVQALAA